MRHHRQTGAALAAALALTLASAHPAVAADPSPEDTAVIESLEKQGLDLSEPQLVEFMFSFPAAQNARSVGKTLAGEGFKSKLETSASSKDVLLLARKRVVLQPQALGELRARFEALARSAQGQYEGWGLP